MEVRERDGLRVVQVTLRSEWSRDGVLEDVRGAVWIEVLQICTLDADRIDEVAQELAIGVAHETLEQNVQVVDWAVERLGDRLEVTAKEFSDSDARQASRSPYFNEHAADVRPVSGW